MAEIDLVLVLPQLFIQIGELILAQDLVHLFLDVLIPVGLRVVLVVKLVELAAHVLVVNPEWLVVASPVFHVHDRVQRFGRQLFPLFVDAAVRDDIFHFKLPVLLLKEGVAQLPQDYYIPEHLAVVLKFGEQVQVIFFHHNRLYSQILDDLSAHLLISIRVDHHDHEPVQNAGNFRDKMVHRFFQPDCDELPLFREFQVQQPRAYVLRSFYYIFVGKPLQFVADNGANRLALGLELEALLEHVLDGLDGMVAVDHVAEQLPGVLVERSRVGGLGGRGERELRGGSVAHV